MAPKSSLEIFAMGGTQSYDSYTAVNQIVAEATVCREGAAGVAGIARAGFPGEYGRQVDKAAVHSYSEAYILRNNNEGGGVDAKAPRPGPNAEKSASKVKPSDNKISNKNHKQSKAGKKNGSGSAAQGAIVEVAGACVIGAVVAGASSGAYAFADWAQGKTDAEEACKRTAKGAGSGLVCGGGSKLLDVGFQKAAQARACQRWPHVAARLCLLLVLQLASSQLQATS